MSTESPPATDQLMELVNAFKAALKPTPTPPSASPMAMPITFVGEAAECSGFLFQVSLYIQMQPHQFSSESAKVAFLISLLTGAYRQGLNPEICAAVALYDDSIGLETFLQRTTRVSQRLAACQPHITTPQKKPSHHGIVYIAVNLVITSVTAQFDPHAQWVLRELHRTGMFKPTTAFMSTSSPRICSKDYSGKLGRGRIHHSSPYITVQVGFFHSERMRFLVLEDSTVSIILGRPWLQQHCPNLRWDPCDVENGELLAIKLATLARRSKASIHHHRSQEPAVPQGSLASQPKTGPLASLPDTLPKPLLIQNPSHPPTSLSALSSGIWTRTFSEPPSRSQHRWNAQKVRSMCPSPNGRTFWAQLTGLRALDTQAAGPSRFYNLVIGGPVCTGIPSGTSKAAQSVPSLTHPINSPQESWFHYPSWFHLGIDFITDLPDSEGNTCVLVIVDRFSKACKLIPLRGLPTAVETAELLFNQVFRHFGLPEIVSDRGPQFTSRVWKAFFKLIGVSVNLSSGYHPQTNGQTERKIQELGRYLRAYCQDDQHSRSSAYSDTSLHCSPGWRNPLMYQLSTTGCERVWDSAHHHLQRAVRGHKSFADARRRAAPNYQPGDLVWLSIRDLRLRLPCRKLSPRYIGSFRILRQINDVTFQLQLPPRYRIHPTFHVSLLKPFSPSATETLGAEAEPPPPEVLDQPSVFTVHEILDSRRRRSRLEYLVDWEGYGPEERSWVNRDDVLDPLLLLEFHHSHPNRPAPHSRGRPRLHVRASGAAPGGGGNVRHSPQPPPSTTSLTAPPTHSASPEF
ncbi:Transposon Tf2-6 polyprotein [Labeo rohita]|uniref:Transposon Tf2-6 polyprotein n=1 Tax=Labeo rohita TaxID=84645 RepID=A0ABQ8L824_LABRO|nr:Transposon Tf2-6 polyprotein [Labeo rohita]